MEKQIKALINRLYEINKWEEKRIKWGDGGEYSKGIIASNEHTIRELKAILELNKK